MAAHDLARLAPGRLGAAASQTFARRQLGFAMFVDEMLAPKELHEFDVNDLIAMRRAAEAESNRLEKLEVKANQRLAARFADLARILKRSPVPSAALITSVNLSGSAKTAQQAWDVAADHRLTISARLLSVRRLLAAVERQLHDNHLR